MYEIEKNDEIRQWIAITKSDSGVSGPDLAKAHMELGRLLGQQMNWLDAEDTTIVAILRGGIFFAIGMYLQMGCKFMIYNPKQEPFCRPQTSKVLLVDSVIHTGKTIQKILEPDMMIACCVIQEEAVPLFADRLFTIRVSKNSFVGKDISRQSGQVGPDTTMRLFNLL